MAIPITEMPHILRISRVYAPIQNHRIYLLEMVHLFTTALDFIFCYRNNDWSLYKCKYGS